MRRRLAVLVCAVLQRILPDRLKPWAEAIRGETCAIDEDGQALLFAMASFSGLAHRAIAFRLLRAWGALAPEDYVMDMDRARGRPRLVGLICAGAAVACGLLYMLLASAPAHYMLINAAALAIGLAVLAIAVTLAGPLRTGAGPLLLLGAVALLATALLGSRAEGAARWITIGSLFIQPSLILLPMMIVGFAHRRDAVSTVAMVIAALGLALQPDRAMAAMLFAGMTLLAISRPDRHTIIAFAGATLGLAAALGRADRLPAVPFVDHVLYSAFDSHPLAGIAVLTGSALLIVPAIIGWVRDDSHRQAYALFGCVWLAAIAAAALGNYPTPIVGYGGSAVIGYVLSVAMLPRRAIPRHVGQAAVPGSGDDLVGPMRRLDTVQAA